MAHKKVHVKKHHVPAHTKKVGGKKVHVHGYHVPAHTRRKPR